MLIVVVQPKWKKAAEASEKTGYIVKKSKDSKKWKAFYFVLNPAKKFLSYYDSHEASSITRAIVTHFTLVAGSQPQRHH